MSELIIAILLLLPIVIVVVVLNYSNKQKKKKAEQRISDYLAAVLGESSMQSSRQKRLVHQSVVVDVIQRKLLVIEQKEDVFSHQIYPLQSIKRIDLRSLQQTVPAEPGQKSESLVTQIGLALSFTDGNAEHFLTFYDMLEHDIYQKAELEKDAVQFQQWLVKEKSSRSVENVLS